MDNEEIISSGEEREEVGPGKPPKEHRFSSTKQPSNEAKSRGQQRRNFTREAIKTILNMPIEMKKDGETYQRLKEQFGEVIDNANIGEIMSFSQVLKAIEEKNTQAYESLIDQALGRPVQAIANTNSLGEDLPSVSVTFPKGMQIDFPSNTEGNDSPEKKNKKND